MQHGADVFLHEHSTLNKMHCVYGKARVLYAVQDM